MSDDKMDATLTGINAWVNAYVPKMEVAVDTSKFQAAFYEAVQRMKDGFKSPVAPRLSDHTPPKGQPLHRVTIDEHMHFALSGKPYLLTQPRQMGRKRLMDAWAQDYLWKQELGMLFKKPVPCSKGKSPFHISWDRVNHDCLICPQCKNRRVFIGIIGIDCWHCGWYRKRYEFR